MHSQEEIQSALPHILVPVMWEAALAVSEGTRGMVDVVWCWEGPWRHPLVQPLPLADEETEGQRVLHNHLPVAFRFSLPGVGIV